jgi:hypothetical protein
LIWVSGKGVCTWKVDDEAQKVVFSPYNANDPPKAIAAAIKANQSWRIAKAIRRKNEDGEWYDVTKALMDEMLFFPFGQHDDLVDATSRIYDIGTTRPRKVTSTDLERYYADA